MRLSSIGWLRNVAGQPRREPLMPRDAVAASTPRKRADDFTPPSLVAALYAVAALGALAARPARTVPHRVATRGAIAGWPLALAAARVRASARVDRSARRTRPVASPTRCRWSPASPLLIAWVVGPVARAAAASARSCSPVAAVARRCCRTFGASPHRFAYATSRGRPCTSPSRSSPTRCSSSRRCRR